MGSDLQDHVRKLVVALREITKRERQQVIERVQENCFRVREDMSQTQSVQRHLASLIAETDPFLLIWVRLSAGWASALQCVVILILITVV